MGAGLAQRTAWPLFAQEITTQKNANETSINEVGFKPTNAVFWSPIPLIPQFRYVILGRTIMVWG
jgi:hypothetical protein